MKLVYYIIKRVLYIIPILIGLIVLTFFAARIVPTDPAGVLAGPQATKEQIEVLRKQYGLDKPLHIQLIVYLKNLVAGDLGISFHTSRPVYHELKERLPATLELTFAAMFVSVLIGIPLGIVCALKRNAVIDHLLRIITIAGLSIAAFWLGIMLMLLFSMWLDIAPLGRRIGSDFEVTEITGLYLIDTLLTFDFETFADSLRHMFLPVLTLAAPCFATITRFTRSGVLDVLQQDFVLYQRSMGVPWFVIVWKYVLRNAITSTVTQIGLLFGSLLAGAVVIEKVFDWPGLGLFAIETIFLADYNAMMAVTLWAGLMFTSMNLLTDIAHAAIDPRVTA